MLSETSMSSLKTWSICSWLVPSLNLMSPMCLTFDICAVLIPLFLKCIQPTWQPELLRLPSSLEQNPVWLRSQIASGFFRPCPPGTCQNSISHHPERATPCRSAQNKADVAPVLSHGSYQRVGRSHHTSTSKTSGFPH